MKFLIFFFCFAILIFFLIFWNNFSIFYPIENREENFSVEFPEEQLTTQIITTTTTFTSPFNYSLQLSHPLIAENARWAKMPIKVFIDTSCSKSKVESIKEAMRIWEEVTNYLIKFEVVEKDYQVMIKCSNFLEESEGYSTIGEAKPILIYTGYFHLIENASIVFLKRRISCVRPIVELHELGHVLGLDHVNDSKNVMYPYEKCDQIIPNYTITTLKELYSIPSLPDLYISNLSLKVSGETGEIEIEIGNKGLIESNETEIAIQLNKKVETYKLKPILPGNFLILRVENLRLENLREIKMILDPENLVKELNEENNQILRLIR
jgi:predicted Zn-dependent protease